ncbi:helix-turn-helix domain-containing protein [Mycobacterium sp. 4D054]|uniref:helix-turn-helix domain-containing protein n=1 Tax=Mycobacterium sp. 4D054 TaxID=3457440 RepID=UPI003FD51E94
MATPTQVAQVVQTSVDALAQDRYRRRGIPYVKIGGRVRYLREDVLAYLAANRVGGSAA